MSLKEVARYGGLVIISILLVLSLITAISTTSARSYLSPEIYKTTLAKNNFYDSFVKSSTKELASQNDISQFLPKDELEKQGNRLIENVIRYANSEKEQLDLTITIDNTLLKKTFEEKITATPVCTANQQPIQGENVVCRPAGISNEVLLSQLLSARGISLEKPQTIDLKPFIDKNNKIATIKDYVSTYKTARLLSWVLVIVFIIAIFFLAPGNPSKMRWVGIPLLITGIVCFFSQGVLAAAIIDTLSIQNVSALLQSVITDLITPFTSNLTVYSVITGIMGILLFGGSFFLGNTTPTGKKE